jgi:hypothetical protein
MKIRKPFWGLLSRRQCLVPTLRGCLVLLLLFMAGAWIALREVHPFLAMNEPIEEGALVVEGWIPDHALAAAVAVFKRNHYSKIYVTGGPLDQGGPLSEFKTYAELGAAVLTRLGCSPDVVQPVPATKVTRDRTFAAAMAFVKWEREHGVTATSFNVISMGTHARRTHLLFEQALGNHSKVGIVAIEERDYDPQRWWKSSEGVKAVLGESFSYCYTKLLFNPSKAIGF